MTDCFGAEFGESRSEIEVTDALESRPPMTSDGAVIEAGSGFRQI